MGKPDPSVLPYQRRKRIMTLRKRRGRCRNCGQPDHLEDSCPSPDFVPPPENQMTSTSTSTFQAPKRLGNDPPQPLMSILPSEGARPPFDEHFANPLMSFPISHDEMYHGDNRKRPFDYEYQSSGGYGADYYDNRPPYNEHFGPQPTKKANPPIPPADWYHENERKQFFDNDYQSSGGYAADQTTEYHDNRLPHNEPAKKKPCDCEIVCVARSLLKYTEGIAKCLETAGMHVDILMPYTGINLATILYNIKLRGVPFAGLVNPSHEKTCSITVNILHAEGQEFRNMPVEEAVKLLAEVFEKHKDRNILRDEARRLEPQDTKTKEKAIAEYNKKRRTCGICGSASHRNNKCDLKLMLNPSGEQGNPDSNTNPGLTSKKNTLRRCTICRAVGHRARNCNLVPARKGSQEQTNQSDGDSNKQV